MRRQYFYRLGALACALLTGIVIIHGVLLYSTRLYLVSEVQNQKAELASVTTTITSADGAALESRLTALTAEAKLLTALPKNPSPAALVNALLALPHAGIKISRLNYQPAGKTPASLGIIGVASTRDTLRSFDTVLTTMPFVSRVDLPVSAYANASNIEFTITLTLSNSLLP